LCPEDILAESQDERQDYYNWCSRGGFRIHGEWIIGHPIQYEGEEFESTHNKNTGVQRTIFICKQEDKGKKALQTTKRGRSPKGIILQAKHEGGTTKNFLNRNGVKK